MPDQHTQFDSMFKSVFMRVFDDIFTTQEETIIPLDKIKKHKGRKDQIAKRAMMVDRIKMEKMKSTLDKLHMERAISEEYVDLTMAKECIKEELAPGAQNFNEITSLMKNLGISKRAASAYFPLDVHIPNYNLKRTMYEWGMGGPTSKQYKLISHMVNFPRKTALSFYLGMISAYIAFREDLKFFFRTDQKNVDELHKYSINKAEEDIIIEAYLPKDDEEMKDTDCYMNEGPSIGKIFLKLNFLTERNEVFKEFVRKTMQLDSRIRMRLAAQYFLKRMFELNVLFIRTQELKYNYIRIAWERKLLFMDDYTICLVLFIKDKSANITWDEVDDIIYIASREVLREGLKTAYDAATNQLAKSLTIDSAP